MTRLRRRAGAGAALAVVLVLAGCGGADDDRSGGEGFLPRPSSDTASGPATPTPDPSDPTDHDAALSQPREDSVYPDVGDPSVDALHYDLALSWDPTTDTLTGTETLRFRATATDDHVQLDFAEPLEIDDLTLDGAEVDYTRDGKDLVVPGDFTEDGRHELVIDYAGTPEPVATPTQREDTAFTGFTIDEQHQTWTAQEPYGAYTWYAVNDQPADKALYDFSLQVPSPWTGIANGEMTGKDDDGTTTTTTFHLAEPASSYLVTLAFGDYTLTEDESSSGTPIDYWVPAGDEQYLPALQTVPDALDYLEPYLGPYPFDTAGILLVTGDAGMETQTLITLGANDYATSPGTIVHELTHQWYGDQVTPDDWRDVWMNEGMAMYLQFMYSAEQEGVGLDYYLDLRAVDEAEFRAAAGPPGDYDPGQFASSNVYYGPAFMWHEIRKKLGDDEFFRLVQGWPASQDNRASDRETLEEYWSSESGKDLSGLFDDWLLSPTTPPRA